MADLFLGGVITGLIIAVLIKLWTILDEEIRKAKEQRVMNDECTVDHEEYKALHMKIYLQLMGNSTTNRPTDDRLLEMADRLTKAWFDHHGY